MISENSELGTTVVVVTTDELSREIESRITKITTTTTALVVDDQYRKHTNIQERKERGSCRDFDAANDIAKSSSAGDACTWRSLLGNREADSQPRRVRHLSLVPPKPKPPIVVQNAARDADGAPNGTTKRRFTIQPYSPSPRSRRRSDMAATLKSSSTQSASSLTNPANNTAVVVAPPGPVAPPRRRKSAPRIVPSSKVDLVSKPNPPATVVEQPASKEAVKPPVASPRRSIKGGGGKRNENGNVEKSNDGDLTLSKNSGSEHIDSISIELEERKERASHLLGDISESTPSCTQGRGAGSNSTNTCGNKTTTMAEPRPTIPPRLRRKGRSSSPASSPVSSPKPSRAVTLPQLTTTGNRENGENDVIQRKFSGTNSSEIGTQNKKDSKPQRDNNSTVSNTSPKTHPKEKEKEGTAQDSDDYGRIPQFAKEEKETQFSSNGPAAPPRVTPRRNTAPNRGPLPPKPSPPPKSQTLLRQTNRRAPVPRPRSFALSQTPHKLTNSSTSSSPPLKQSPVHLSQEGLLPWRGNTITKSSPSLLRAVIEIPQDGEELEKVGGTDSQGGKAKSESPCGSPGRRLSATGNPARAIAEILKERRSTAPSQSVSPRHVVSQSATVSPSHVTTSPGHVTERRGSYDTPAGHRVRVLPVPLQGPEEAHKNTDNQPMTGSDHSKSVSNILSLPASPARHLPGRVPPKPPSRFPKSSSVSDMLEMKEDEEETAVESGSDLSRDLVSESRRVKGEGEAVVATEDGWRRRKKKENEEERGEDKGVPEPKIIPDSILNLSTKRKRSERNRPSKSSLAKQRAASVGDISLIETVPIGGSDTSSYTSSEGRASVMSSEHQSPLLERARQLSKTRKWCNQPEVKEMGIVPNLAKEQLLQQEAIFEILTSEASYHLNLATLIDRFMDDHKLDPNYPDSVLDRTQHSMIFSNVKEIRSISARFLEEILVLFNEDVFLGKIFPVLEDYAMNRFVCYERYCASQSHRLKELRDCSEKNENFQKQLRKLEEEANQTLQSLATAPMQRITKLPLLMNEVLKRTPTNDPRRDQMESTHRATQQIADLCNKGAGKIGDLVHLETIWKKLHFGQLKPFLILAPGRRLKKEGTIDRLRVNSKRKARVMPDKIQHYLFVFTDLFMITTEEKDRHHVVDYCPLNKISVESIATSPSSPTTLDTSSSSSSDDSYTKSGAEWTVAVAGEEHAFLVTLQESAETGGSAGGGGGGGGGGSKHSGTVDGSYIFVVRSEADKGKWMELLKESNSEDLANTPKALSGRNLTLLTRKKHRDIPTKKYWWKQPEVEQSGVVKRLTQLQLELQEAIFEVVTSEEEHLAAMKTLVHHYMSDSGLDPRLPEQQRVLNEEEFNDIFRYVSDVYNISEGLLKMLHARQKENVVVDTICDIILLCVERRFRHCYVRYCTNLPNALDQLDTSIEKNESFSGYLKQLEEDQRPLRSLLKAPMDRVMQLPHLFRTVLKKTPTSDLNHHLVEATLRALEKMEWLCSSGQQKVERFKEMYSLERQLDFGGIKPFSLVSVGRSLVKQGYLVKLKSQWFGKAVRRKTNYLIVLSDYLLITKKIENMYKVMDVSLLDRLVVERVEPHSLEHNSTLTRTEDAMADARWAVSKAGENHAFLVTLPDVKRSYVFVAKSEEERGEWIDSLRVQNLMSFEEESDSGTSWEYFYMEASCDHCPPSESRAPEDLDMKKGDLLRVYRANDEYCEGLRVHDLHWGKFPTRHLEQAPPGRRETEEAGLGGFLVQATHDFVGGESGELPLEKGDVVRVARQLAGWCEGKKLSGNKWGWFPRTHTQSMSTSRSSSLASSSSRPTLTSRHSPSPPPPQPSPSPPISDLLLLPLR